MADLDSLNELLRSRRSVRGFSADPVPPELLGRVFTAAQQAPSNCNVQPWVVHVVSGEAAHRMRELLSGHVLSGGPASPDFEREGGYPGVYRERQIDAAVRLFTATGVAREDVAARNASMFRNSASSTRRTPRSSSCPPGAAIARRAIAGCTRSR